MIRAALLLLALSGVAGAWPQNVRLGYPNCGTCHVSPSGGGALNGYGKGTAPEFATWTVSKHQDVDTPIISGGDLRYLWLKREGADGSVYEDRFLMQADLELGVAWKQLTFVGQYGQYYAQPRSKEASFKHYALWTHKSFTARAGKFTPAFGINHDDHTLPGRNAVGFSSRNPSYNLEMGWGNEVITIMPTLIFGCQGGYTDAERKTYCDDGENGQSVFLSYAPNRIFYGSFSAAYLQRNGESRLINALAWTVGNKYVYTIGEIVKQRKEALHKKPESTDEGWADVMGSYRGIDLGLTYRHYADERIEQGVKARWIPLPGAEFTLVFLTDQDQNRKTLVVGHFYL